MRRFHFRLETALRLRTMAEQEAQGAFAAAERELAAAESWLTALIEQRSRHQSYRTAIQAQTLDMGDLAGAARQAEAIDAAIVAQRTVIVDARAVRDARREQWRQKRAEREALETLKQRRRAEHLAAERAAEQNEMDEMAVLRFGRT